MRAKVMTRYLLVRDSDGLGDSGPMCEILDEESYKPIPDVTYPRVGCGIRVGSPCGRTYSGQDWWQTSPITEILQESINDEGYWTVKFKTEHSTYTWKEF
jgi:hypothetical protein